MLIYHLSHLIYHLSIKIFNIHEYIYMYIYVCVCVYIQVAIKIFLLTLSQKKDITTVSKPTTFIFAFNIILKWKQPWMASLEKWWYLVWEGTLLLKSLEHPVLSESKKVFQKQIKGSTKIKKNDHTIYEDIWKDLRTNWEYQIWDIVSNSTEQCKLKY